MARTIGYDSAEENVAEGADMSPITIDAKRADQAHVYVDDGTGSAVTEAYTLLVEVEKTLPHDSTTDTYFTDAEVGVSGSTSKHHALTDFPSGKQARLTLTNDSDAGAAQDYRVVFETQSMN